MPEMDGVRCLANTYGELEHHSSDYLCHRLRSFMLLPLLRPMLVTLLKPAKDELIDALSKASNLNAAQLDGIRKQIQCRVRHVSIAAHAHRGDELGNISDIY